MSAGPSEVEASVDVSPFDLRPASEHATGAAALCLHGLTGTPYEVRPIAEALVRQGVRARGIWMAGHNGTVDDLARATRADWIALARDELVKLRAEHERVFVCGVSMGGLVSLRLAQTDLVDAVVTVGVPLRLNWAIRLLVPLLRRVSTARPKQRSHLADPEARARHPHFPAMPYASVHELVQLGRTVHRELPRVEVPILVSHGELDTTANPADARTVYEGVSTPPANKQLMMLARSTHVATVDYDGPTLVEAAARFLVAR